VLSLSLERQAKARVNLDTPPRCGARVINIRDLIQDSHQT